jgi:pimeloyl-ACP methyl ester carboxylesterase
MATPSLARRLRRLGAFALGGSVLATGMTVAGGTLLAEQLTSGGDPARLTRAWSTVPTRFVERPEGRIAYDDRGDGPLVVAVPSLGDLRQEYRFLTPRLVEAGYRVVTMDLRGHGESDATFSAYTPEAVGADIVALIEQLDAGPARIVGTSMAAGAAAWAAAERPDLVTGLVLIGPFVRELPSPFLQTLALKALLTRPWGPAAWSLYYKSLYPTAAPADLSDYRAVLKRNLKQPGRFHALREMVWSPRAPVEARLAEVEAPVLVLMGTKDPDFPDPTAEARLVAERLNGAVALIEGAGHYPHAEMPEEAATHILPFLRAAGAGAVAHGR